MLKNKKYHLCCRNCGKTFLGLRKGLVFCTPTCRSLYKKHNIRQHGDYCIPGTIHTGTVGRISELLVATDLLMKGYEVFEAVSPCAGCDLIAIKEKKIYRIEVRTGRKNAGDGKITYSKGRRDLGKQDTFAIVVSPQKIIYDPPVFERG